MTTIDSSISKDWTDSDKKLSSAPCTPSISASESDKSSDVSNHSSEEISETNSVLSTSSYEFDTIGSHKTNNNHETRRHLHILLNGVLNNRNHYELLDDVLKSRGLEIVVRTDPYDLIQESDLKSIPPEQRSQVKEFVKLVLIRQRDIYAEKNFHHMDNLTLKRMIPDVVRNWRKGNTDIEKIVISVPPPMVGPMITTPMREQLLSDSGSIRGDGSIRSEDEFNRNLVELSRASSPFSFGMDSDAVSLSSSVSDMMSTRSSDVSNGRIRSINHSQTNFPVRFDQNAHISPSSSVDDLSSSAGISVTSCGSSQQNHRTVLTMNDIPMLEKSIREQTNPSHGRLLTKKDQLNAYIESCKPSDNNVNATILYNNYCKWCEHYNYEKYTRPMVIDSFREKLGDYEVKNSSGRSRGWSLTLPTI